MNTWSLFQLLVVLFAMMLTGYAAYKGKWLNDNAYSKICGLIVHVFNPLLIISGVVGKDLSETGSLISQNLLLVLIMFGSLILVSIPIPVILHIAKPKRNLYRLMLIFSNLGFMGIPLITTLYGGNRVIFVSFYVLVFNVLAYTLGIYLLSSSGGRQGTFSIHKVFNFGTAACIISIILFYFRIPVSDSVDTFVSYMGNAAVPLSMMMIGASLAKSDLKILFKKFSDYKFIVIKMLVIPIAFVLILKNFTFDQTLLGIFMLMVSMPVASVVPMLSEQYGAPGDGQEASRIVALTTIVSLFSLPIVSFFL